MTFFKLFLALTLAASGATSFAQAQAAEHWTDSVCRTSSKQLCLMAKGYSYLRRANVIIDPALNTIALSTGTYTLAIVARAVLGETPEVVFVLTVSRAGMQAGTIMLLGGVAFAVIGTLTSAATFLLATTVKTAPPEEDEFLVRQCLEKLAPYKTVEGITRLQELTPDEFQALLPCIPADKDFGRFLSDVGRQGDSIENQIHAN